MNYERRIERLEAKQPVQVGETIPGPLRPQFTKDEWLEMVRLYMTEKLMSQAEAMRTVLKARPNGITSSDAAYIDAIEKRWGFV